MLPPRRRLYHIAIYLWPGELVSGSFAQDDRQILVGAETTGRRDGAGRKDAVRRQARQPYTRGRRLYRLALELAERRFVAPFLSRRGRTPRGGRDRAERVARTRGFGPGDGGLEGADQSRPG